MATSQTERKAYKNWFDKAAAQALAAQVTTASTDFDERRFVRLATKGLAQLEFADRVRQFSSALAATLPDSVPEALTILTESLPEIMPNCDSVTDGWLQWPVGQFVADHGLEHFEPSMTAMIELTKRFSSEFAVRPFVEHRPKETFERLLALTQDANPHVRRWCSEGTRPRLPWGKRLNALSANPSPIWPILEALKDDPERYVQRSVANNLNDIAKDHPTLVVRRCKRWSRGKHSPERAQIVKHALRSLVKSGDPDALALAGLGPPIKITASLNVRPRKVGIGGEVELACTLSSSAAKAQDLLVDYVVHFVRQREKSSAKVFKWKKARIAARGQIELRKRHRLHVTTIRALYPGVHRVELQINGVRMASTEFRLT